VPAKSKAVMRTADEMRDYCDALRMASAREYRQATEASRELRAVLSPHGYLRAWMVAGNLTLAARMCKLASGYAVATYLSFLKHFEVEIAEAKSRAPRAETRAAAGTSGFKFGE
jgi:hypothetical protein